MSKQVTAWSCNRNLSLPSQLPLQSRYEALGVVDEAHDETEEEEPVQALSPRSDRTTSFQGSSLPPWGLNQEHHQTSDNLSTAFGLLLTLALSRGY